MRFGKGSAALRMAAHHDWPEHAPGVANAGRGAGAGWRRGFLAERSTDGLDPEAQGEFDAALDRSLSDALPALGLVFGIGVLLFSAWDYWVDPVVAAGTLVVRLGLVLLGAAGYVSWGGRFPVAWRCALVYITHASAMVVSSALLPGGMVLAMPAITGAMFPLALVEPRPARLAVLVLPPSLLFLLLAAQVMAPPVFATCVLVYGVVLCLVAAVAVFQRRLLRADFLAERVLAWTARHDSLSGVLARGYLMELAGHDLAAARRYGRPLAIAMLDIDYFKRVNDSWGHAVGDRLLCAVSRACAAQLRASDYLGRVGGEEFVCVMPETGEAEALACAERMRVAVAAIRLDAPGGVVRCTASLGVAALGSAHADFTALMAAADGALYRAKSNGRDRIELAGRQADE